MAALIADSGRRIKFSAADDKKTLRGRGHTRTKGKNLMALGCEVEQAPKKPFRPLQVSIIGSLANAFHNPEEGVLCFSTQGGWGCGRPHGLWATG